MARGSRSVDHGTSNRPRDRICARRPPLAGIRDPRSNDGRSNAGEVAPGNRDPGPRMLHQVSTRRPKTRHQVEAARAKHAQNPAPGRSSTSKTCDFGPPGGHQNLVFCPETWPPDLGPRPGEHGPGPFQYRVKTLGFPPKIAKNRPRPPLPVTEARAMFLTNIYVKFDIACDII